VGDEETEAGVAWRRSLPARAAVASVGLAARLLLGDGRPVVPVAVGWLAVFELLAGDLGPRVAA
jgi:hypothetical protein